MIMSQAMGSVGNFFPTIIQSLQYNNIITLVLTAPPYILVCFIFLGLSWYSDVSRGCSRCALQWLITPEKRRSVLASCLLSQRRYCDLYYRHRNSECPCKVLRHYADPDGKWYVEARLDMTTD